MIMSINYVEQRSANYGPKVKCTAHFCIALELKLFLHLLMVEIIKRRVVFHDMKIIWNSNSVSIKFYWNSATSFIYCCFCATKTALRDCQRNHMTLQSLKFLLTGFLLKKSLLPLIWSILCASHCYKWFRFIKPLNLHSGPMKKQLLCLSPFYRWESEIRGWVACSGSYN